MNSSLQRVESIVINSTTIALSSISLCVSIGMFLFISFHLRKMKTSPNRVALLLTTNMYLAMLLFSLLLLEQTVRSLIGCVYSLASLNDGIYCQLRAYFLLVFICNIYYANTLQAIYRLCRIIFYQNQSLQSFKLYQILIMIQWILCFLLIIPTYLLNDFQYLVDDYHCQIAFTNYRSTLLNGVLVYSIPMSLTSGCYIYTLRKMRRGNNHFNETMTEIQKISARRDLLVLFRICLLLGLLMLFFIPSAIILFIYNFTGILLWWSVDVQWLTFSFSICSVTVLLVFISPHVQSLWTQNVVHQQRQRQTPQTATLQMIKIS